MFPVRILVIIKVHVLVIRALYKLLIIINIIIKLSTPKLTLLDLPGAFDVADKAILLKRFGLYSGIKERLYRR